MLRNWRMGVPFQRTPQGSGPSQFFPDRLGSYGDFACGYRLLPGPRPCSSGSTTIRSAASAEAGPPARILHNPPSATASVARNCRPECRRRPCCQRPCGHPGGSRRQSLPGLRRPALRSPVRVLASQDPMAEKYYGISPYAYCAGNPVNLVDQMGLSPIYNTEGRFLGTDDEGLQGQPIIIANDSFIQGLSHVDAMKLDLGYKGLSSIEAVFRLLANYTNLPNRPDYDGYVSVMEGIQWAKNHPNALKNPTAENTLYIDTSKLDFGLLSTTEFQKENTVFP